MIELTIKSKKNRAFTPKEGGAKVPYFWYTAIRKSDEVEFTFGSKNEYAEGDELQLDLIKAEGSDGKARWKEIY